MIIQAYFLSQYFKITVLKWRLFFQTLKSYPYIIFDPKFVFVWYFFNVERVKIPGANNRVYTYIPGSMIRSESGTCPPKKPDPDQTCKNYSHLLFSLNAKQSSMRIHSWEISDPDSILRLSLDSDITFYSKTVARSGL